MSDTDPIDPTRVMDMFWLFSRVLPLDPKQATKIMGVDFLKLIPDLALVLGKQASKYPDDFNGFLEFIKQATAYIRNETDEYPNIDQNEIEMNLQMTKAIEDFNKNAKPAKF